MRIGHTAALEAIRARLDGEWDHPALVVIGVLHTDPVDDICLILHYALDQPEPYNGPGWLSVPSQPD